MTHKSSRKPLRSTRAFTVNGALVPLVVAVLALGGCGGVDDVQLNGKIFDAVGLSGNAAKSAEPKVAQRAPLVIPPSLDRIPEPGKQPDAEAAQTTIAAIKDPDKVARASQAELEKQQAAYCKVNYEEARQRGDDNADLAEGPLGPCRGSALTAIQKWNNSDEAGDDSN